MSKGLQRQHNQNGVVVQQHSVQSFSGPLPHPDILRKFEEVVPGSAERIIKMAEDQSAHRKDLEQKVISSDIARSKWGQILGFVIAVAGLVVSAIISIYGNAIAGGIIGVGTLASLVGVFMYGSTTRSKEREVKKSEE
ncbi:MAG TPA: hypothetical protein DCS23_02030 [Candidatus Yonathbacteria bacterium]|nr:hypothetical protein [Candidatus Yonathbacteria bacterium]